MPEQPTRRMGQAQRDPAWVRGSLILAATSVVGVLIVIPVVHVFAGALSEGVRVYWDNLVADPDTRHSILLTLTVVPLALAANVAFGIAAAWAIARFRFPGRTVLTAMIDLPFSVSPVVAGLMLVLIFGLQGYLGPFLRTHDVKILFATPGLILATAFVTFPFVARELIPVMEAIGPDEETAPTSSGAWPTGSSSATRARWASSAPSTSSPATSPARPIPCPCAWRSCSRSTTCPAPSPWRPSSPCSPS
jgi:sulfate/thiosulfate transport system permease protein